MKRRRSVPSIEAGEAMALMLAHTPFALRHLVQSPTTKGPTMFARQVAEAMSRAMRDYTAEMDRRDAWAASRRDRDALTEAARICRAGAADAPFMAGSYADAADALGRLLDALRPPERMTDAAMGARLAKLMVSIIGASAAARFGYHALRRIGGPALSISAIRNRLPRLGGNRSER